VGAFGGAHSNHDRPPTSAQYGPVSGCGGYCFVRGASVGSGRRRLRLAGIDDVEGICGLVSGSGSGKKSSVGSGNTGTKGAFGTPSAARQKSEAIRRQQAKEAKRRKIVLGVILAAILIGIGVTIVLVVLQSSDDSSSSGGEFSSPLGATESAIPVGEEAAPVRMDIFQDYMCPACGQFEQISGETVDGYVDDGTVRVYYHTMSFLDRTSNGTRYSTRAASSAGCAADQGVFREYNRLLYQNQPSEGTNGLSDDELIDIGAQAGTNAPAFEVCVRNLDYEEWVGNVTEDAFNDGVEGTPTVRVDGQSVEDITPAGLTKAIEDALKGEEAPATTSPSPVPSD